jgi:gamma-polyglutamate biosynthesis protein CapA
MKHTPTLLVLVLVPMYVLGVFVADVLAPEEIEQTDGSTVTLTFVGDMMFDRYIRERAVLQGYDAVLAEALPLFESSDVLIGNLEGPITNFASVSDWREGGSNHYKFTFATTVAQVLADVGFSAVSLANNHALNFGEEGIEQTKNWLASSSVGYFGSPSEPYEPWRTTVHNKDIAVYAFDTWYARDADELVTRIQAEDENTFVVVYAHWGDEYERNPNSGQRDLAHRFIDAGADFIAGAHPHVIQTKEQYNSKWIYYSLGNFVFDQYFDEYVECGSVVSVVVKENNSYTVKEKFVEMVGNGTTRQRTCNAEVRLQ